MAVTVDKPTVAAAKIDAAESGIKQKVILAQGMAADIRMLFDAVLDATQGQDDVATRYAAVRAVVDGGATAFKNRFNSDLLYETGVDAATVSTDNQKRTYCLYARVWVGLLVSLLLAGKQ